MTALSAGMTREQAAELLAAHNKDPFHIEHGETVEQTMRYFAREYDPENEEFWGIVGLLHDLDWEEHDDEPEKHTLYAAPLIEEAGGTPELIRAIQSHTSDYNTDLPKPELQMEKILFATEELTGLIGAAIVMRPSKSVMDFNVKSLKKKYKDKRFAAGVSREVIASGAEMLGWELDELFARTIEAAVPSPPTAARSSSRSRGLRGRLLTFVRTFYNEEQVVAAANGGPPHNTCSDCGEGASAVRRGRFAF